MFDKKLAKIVMDDVNRILKEHIGEEYGVKVVSGRFDTQTLTLKVEVGIRSEASDRSDNAWSKEYQDLLGLLKYGSFNLTPDCLGKLYDFGNGASKIVGFSEKSSRFPFIVERVSDRKRFKVSGGTVGMIVLAATKGE